jgi:hypothetical protein
MTGKICLRVSDARDVARLHGIGSEIGHVDSPLTG